MTSREIAEAVYAHAEANYEKGWDPIVECYTIEELIEEIQLYDARTTKQAIKAFAKGLNLRAAYGNDVRAAGDNDYRQTEHAAL